MPTLYCFKDTKILHDYDLYNYYTGYPARFLVFLFDTIVFRPSWIINKKRSGQHV